METKTMKPLHEDSGIHVTADAIGYEQSASGMNINCGHCGKTVFEKYPKGDGSVSMTIEGLICPHCGGANVFDG